MRGESPYMPLRPYSNKEWSALQHVTFASEKDWDPTYLEYEGQLENEE